MHHSAVVGEPVRKQTGGVRAFCCMTGRTARVLQGGNPSDERDRLECAFDGSTGDDSSGFAERTIGEPMVAQGV
jgi:hypothetical protein